MKKILGTAAALALAAGAVVGFAAPAQAAPAKAATATVWQCDPGYRPIYIRSYGNTWKGCQNIKNPRLIYIVWG